VSRFRYFTVRGSGNFPFELLSRDQCFPANVVEADAIRMACPTVADERTITLATARMDGPTTVLWQQARWPVIAIP
jgi:hypothetical protein